ncbi:MAG TPA: LysE family translocator [Sphingomicrobium sp.]|jgi:threonine/homoserine/homoserine lactone efflux protein|nr:LysE family translocator [Sphingomicrobium sp.]
MLEVAGVELLPPLATFLAFALAGLALNIVPGADMTFVIASAARGGRRDGITAALGIGGGALVHVLAAVLGLSALLAASQTAFTLIKWVGAAYLLYIAISLVLSRGSTEAEDKPRRQLSGWRLFRAAALVNILNPKVALFFLAFLPQFIDPKAEVPALQILCLGLWFDFVGTLVNCIVAIAAADTAARLRHVSWLGTAARWVAATAMGTLAVRLAFAERR